MRAELLEDGLGAGMTAGDEQRQTLLDNTETLERSSAKLTQSQRIALETEHVGAQILNDLYSQRQTIQRSRDRLRETDHELNESSRTLNLMIRRSLQNRFVLTAIAVVIFLVIIISIYVVMTRGN